MRPVVTGVMFAAVTAALFCLLGAMVAVGGGEVMRAWDLYSAATVFASIGGGFFGIALGNAWL